YTARLALLEEQKSLPWQAVWEMYCQRHDTPAGSQWLDSVRAYATRKKHHRPPPFDLRRTRKISTGAPINALTTDTRSSPGTNRRP
ncbi:L-rhamnose isomerase, partial [Salmonella enterica subsp. enterica serovar Montevideo]|nr:L-rhamnose isomerase [Salmonella enterica subsp. enterica serovar Montevideo]